MDLRPDSAAGQKSIKASWLIVYGRRRFCVFVAKAISRPEQKLIYARYSATELNQTNGGV